MYGLSNGENIFDPRWLIKVKDQGQTLITLKLNISNTVQDWKSKKSDKKWCMGFQMAEIFWPQMTFKDQGQGQTLKSLKSNISKTVRYGGEMSIGDR